MDTRYLELRHILELHARQIEKFGGSPGIRDAGLIETALLRPRTGYYRDILEEAAAMWESLTMNHSFVDGNKRIGFAAMHVFLRLNGYDFSAPSKTAVEFVLKNLESGTFTKDILDAWLRENTRDARVE